MLLKGLDCAEAVRHAPAHYLVKPIARTLRTVSNYFLAFSQLEQRVSRTKSGNVLLLSDTCHVEVCFLGKEYGETLPSRAANQ